MFKKFITAFFVLFCIAGVFYLALPDYSFPMPPPDSIQSQEPADLESPLRRGYFTNYTRQEVLDWYGRQFDHSSFLGLKIPTSLFNYPPENAQTIIRDQTGSTFLQEYAHPFRESMFINGFEPPSFEDKPIFLVDGKPWKQKIIIRLVPSNIWVREVIFLVTMTMTAVVFREYIETFKKKNG